MWKEIVNAEYMGGYSLLLLFNDGQRRLFDFTSLIDKYPVFKPLRDLTLFKSFVLTDTLEWNDGAIDIAPEYLYDNGVAA